jgi:hypothetical protein
MQSSEMEKRPSRVEGLFVCGTQYAGGLRSPHLGGAGVNISRLRPGSGLGLGLGAFLVSLRPLSLLPMGASMTQKARWREELKSAALPAVQRVNAGLLLCHPSRMDQYALGRVHFG